MGNRHCRDPNRIPLPNKSGYICGESAAYWEESAIACDAHLRDLIGVYGRVGDPKERRVATIQSRLSASKRSAD